MAGGRAACIDRLERLLADYRVERPDPPLEVRPFFSGAAGYVEGRIFMSLTPVGLALKLPEDRRRMLLADGGAPLRYFPKAPVKKAYVLLGDGQVEDRAVVFALITCSVAFVRET